MEHGTVADRAQFQPRRGGVYIMPKTRSSWGSNSPAARKGYRTLRYWADKHDGRGYRRCCKTIKGTKRDGDAELARLRIMHDEDKPTPTVRDCYEAWYMPDAEPRLSPNTLRQYKSAWRTAIEPRWGDLPVTDVKPLDVQEWLLTLSAGAAHMASKVMSGILDFPVMYEMIDRNPMRIKYRMPTAKAEKDKSVYDLAQSLHILEVVEGSYIEAAVILALFGSCRVGESLSPLAAEVKEARASNGMLGCIVRLCRQVDFSGDVSEILKTKSSTRPVVIVGKPAARLLAIARERIEAGEIWLSDDGTGSPISQRALGSEWRRLLEMDGMKPIMLRNMRNSWRTFSEWELHIAPDQLETLMGHVGATVTAKHYNRPDESMLLDAVAEAYDRAWHFEEFKAN